MSKNRNSIETQFLQFPIEISALETGLIGNTYLKAAHKDEQSSLNKDLEKKNKNLEILDTLETLETEKKIKKKSDFPIQKENKYYPLEEEKIWIQFCNKIRDEYIECASKDLITKPELWNKICNDTYLKKAKELYMKENNLVAKQGQGPQVKFHFFTWNNYDKNGMRDQNIKLLLDALKKHCVRWIFQEEIGELGTPHLQGNLEMKFKKRFTELKLPKEIITAKTNNIKAAFDYCEKDATRNGKTWVFPEPKPEPKPLDIITELQPWMKSLIESINTKADYRTVNWVYDLDGCGGKTGLCKYLITHLNTMVATGGKVADIAALIRGEIESGRDLNDNCTFIFNLARDITSISYQAIENLKDGLITSTKYESKTLVFNCPHVWVMSNVFPQTDKLSKDRWRIWVIKDNELVPYTIEEHKLKFNEE